MTEKESSIRRLLLPGILAAAVLLAPLVALRAQSQAPVGNAAQLMRGIFFPNSNIVFTVQTVDPAEPPTPTSVASQSGGTSVFAWGQSIYTGWQVVDNAAVALIDVSPLLLAPGLKCENGRDAPIRDAQWIKATQEMVAVSKRIYDASRKKDRDLVSELTGDLSDSCAACHRVYRDVGGRGRGADPTTPNIAGRCQSQGK